MRAAAAVWAWLSFAGVQPVLERGRARRLTDADALPVPAQLRVAHAKIALAAHLARGLPLWRALLLTFQRPLWRGVAFRLLSELAALAVPLLIAQCVRRSQHPAVLFSAPAPAPAPALALAIALALASLLQFTALNHYIHATFETALGARTAAAAVVYDKALRLADAQAHKGRLVALLAKDTDALETFFIFAHNLWSAPLSALLTCALLAHLLGPAVLVGLAVTAVAIPLETRANARLKTLQKAVAAHTDARLHHVANALAGVRLVKLALEPHFRAEIASARAREVAATLRAAYTKALTLFLMAVTPVAVTLGTLGFYVWQGHELHSDTVFPALVLFGALGHPFKIFPKVIELRVTFLVACERLQKLLASEEVAPLPASMQHAVPVPSVTLKDASLRFASAPPGTGALVLRNVTLSVAGRGLVCVAGAVGAGKSLLLAGLLGEAALEAGTLQVDGTVALCPQASWLCNASLRANVVMNQPFVAARFWDVLAACQLTHEVQALPQGDLTEIGEKGHALSGGQRQRVSLARAFYADRNVYLLDDPLASLDPVVAEAVFVQAILPLAATRPCIMICNDAQMLARAQQVVTVADGHMHVIIVDQPRQPAQIPPLFLNPANYSHVDGTDRDAAAAVWTAGLLARSDPSPTASPTPTSAVDARVYWTYAQACGRGLAAAMAALAVGTKGLDLLKDYELSRATRDPAKSRAEFVSYAALSTVAFLCIAGRLLLLATMGLRASCQLHDRLLDAVLRAPLSFFQQTPVGRLLVLFSSDFDVIDNRLSGTLGAWAESVLTAAAAVLLLTVVSGWVLLALVPVLWVYGRVRALYMASSVDLKRLTQESKGPLMSQLSQSLDGAASIRAYGLQGDMSRTNVALAHVNADVYYTHMLTNRWLSFRLDLIGASIVWLAASAALYAPALSGGLAGLVLTYAIQITYTLSYGIRSTATLETEFASVERVLQFCAIPSERQDGRPCPAAWPARGRVQFDDVSVQYAPTLPPALHGVSFTLQPGQHVGIVGQTGGGKSTTVNAMFRLVEVSAGRILIDDIDIATLSLASLRAARMVLVSQEPVLFSGKLRVSLDPSGRCDDNALWAALELVGLKPLIRTWAGGLDHALAADAISAGERQLLCLARALVYDPKIVVLDEASAHIDPESDKVLQMMLATRFKDCTIIKIAHRLEDVAQCDTLMVVDQGCIVETGTPRELLKNPASRFSRLATELGAERSAALTTLASMPR